MVRESLLSSLQSDNPLLDLLKAGASAQAVKDKIMATLKPLFRNQDILLGRAGELLAGVYMNVIRLRSNMPSIHIEKLIAFLNDRIDKAPETVKAATARWDSAIAENDHRFWNLDHSYNDEDLYDRAFKTMRSMGAIIETLLQPYLRLMFDILAARDKSDSNPSSSLPLGQVVDKLTKQSELGGLLAASNAGISISQWRNIAQHGDWRVEGSNIIVTYGLPAKRKTRSLTRSEMDQALQTAFETWRMLKTTWDIFTLDNNELLSPCISAPNDPYSSAALLSTNLLAQGFAVTSLKVSHEITKMTVRDLTDGDMKGRAAHASQFVVTVYTFFGGSISEVTYEDRSGVPQHRFRATSDLCEQAIKCGLESVAGEMVFESLQGTKQSDDVIKPR